MELKTWELMDAFWSWQALCRKESFACCIESWYTWMVSLELGEECYNVIPCEFWQFKNVFFPCSAWKDSKVLEVQYLAPMILSRT